jgi:hypothetical protein
VKVGRWRRSGKPRGIEAVEREAEAEDGWRAHVNSFRSSARRRSALGECERRHEVVIQLLADSLVERRLLEREVAVDRVGGEITRPRARPGVPTTFCQFPELTVPRAPD